MASNDNIPIRPDFDAQAAELVGHARELAADAAAEIVAGRLRDAYRAGQIAEITGRIGADIGRPVTTSSPDLPITFEELQDLAADLDVKASLRTSPVEVRAAEVAAMACRYLADRIGAPSQVTPSEASPIIISSSPSHIVVAIEMSCAMLARHRRFLENLLEAAGHSETGG